MRKVALILAFVMLLSIPVSAQAAVTPRIYTAVPGLWFEGTTANCSLTVSGNNTSDSITAIVKLWQGDTCLALWVPRAEGYMFFSDTWSVTAGEEYVLTADITINGVKQPSLSVSGTCN